MKVEVSDGEVLDKLSILEIKLKNITDENKLANIQKELDAAIEELRREFASLAITAAERVIEGSLDESRHEAIIEKVLEDAPKTSSS